MKRSSRRYWKGYGHRLRVTRLALGLTEQQAAEAYQVTLRTYRRYEDGQPQGSGSGWLRFAEKYDVRLSWLGGQGSLEIGRHLQFTKSKVAILPILTAERRAQRLFHFWP
jgi:transcriptional regulator with XRE-family HTH domain